MLSRSKVMQADIDAAIVGETYTVLPNGRTTVCQLTLDNGFTAEGLSACVSIENFNAEKGNAAARERALDQVWMLLGFRLRDRLAPALTLADAEADVAGVERPDSPGLNTSA